MTFAGWTSVACLGVLVYLYVGYPAALWALGRIRARPVARGPIAPFISVLVPAHNEAEVIDAKVENTLASGYPKDRMEVLVLCDGSTDGTGKRVQALVEEREAGEGGAGGCGAPIRVLELPRGGKARALNAGARAARGEILVFTDANTFLSRDALRHVVENFADPEVGGVCGDKRYGEPAGAGPVARGEGAYWRYDRWVKDLESRVGSIFASDGALHAVRRELFQPIRNPASADDMAISMRVVLQGRRLVYDPRAVVVEAPPTDPEAEFQRKVRVTNHSMRALLDLGPALWTSGLYSVQLLSHKFVRHLSPPFLAGLFVASAGAASGGSLPFLLLFSGQVAFYGLAALGHGLRGTRVARRLAFAAPYHFTLIQLAAALGIVSLLRGRRLAVWTPRGGLEPGGSG
jgi:cellulose synthase/poly-beta-1,6-N-acetylglucosamine synthase-like glycosyltransferase